MTPFLKHLPLHPGVFLGYGAAILGKKLDVEIIDLNAEIYYKNKHKWHQFFAEAETKELIVDNLDIDPLYHQLLSDVEKDYRQIAWHEYQSIFITTPSWFVTVPTENILKLTGVIKTESPDSTLFFYGNSLGSWTDENELKKNSIQILHLNDLYHVNPVKGPVNYDSLPVPIYSNRKKYIFDMLPFRLRHGCIWGKCRFCSLAKGWNSGYRERSAKHALLEIEELIEKYNPTMFVCKDNSINGNNLMEFCTLLKGFEKPWGALARADLGNKEIEALSKAGCRLLYFGLESGSDRVLKEINKGIQTKQISDFIKNLYNSNIMPAPSMFVGSPGEKEDDFEMTLQFISDHSNYLDALNVYPLALTPASEFTLENKMPNSETLTKKLFRLIAACNQLGIKAYVGEQSGEYLFGKKVYPGRIGY